MIFSSFDSLVLSRYRDLFHVVCVVGRTWSSELGRVRDWSSHLPSLPRTSHRGGKATYSILRSQCVLLNYYFWAKINFSPLGIFIVLFSFFIGNNGSLRMWFNWLSNSSLSGLHSVSGCRRGGERNQGSYHHVGHSLKGRFCCREMINEFFLTLSLRPQKSVSRSVTEIPTIPTPWYSWFEDLYFSTFFYILPTIFRSELRHSVGELEPLLVNCHPTSLPELTGKTICTLQIFFDRLFSRIKCSTRPLRRCI